ncbi:reverse transcriptase domain-containing protein [Tanacetum coccineum]
MPTSIQKKTFSPLKDCLILTQLPPSLRKNQKFKELKTVKPSSDELPELELKDLPPHFEYVFLEGTDKLPVIIAKDLKDEDKTALLKVLRSHKRAIAWKMSDIKGIDPKFCTHKILMEDNVKLRCITVIENDDNELIPTRLITGWRVCIDYRKLNDVTRKDHFPLRFMDQMLERLAGNEYYYFLDGFSGYFQIPIDPKDQEKTPYLPLRRFWLPTHGPFVAYCNAPRARFHKVHDGLFHDMIEETMEVFMDDFSVFGDSFSLCLSHLDKMLKRYEDINLVLNWEKCHFMVKDGIVIGHKISKSGIKVDKAKVDVCSRLLKISQPMTRLLEKETPFVFSKECVEAFNALKKKLTKAPILVAPDLDLPFEIMCDASDYAIKKEAENLAAAHLSRLENPYQSELEKKEITETFPLETLGMVTFRGDDSTPWFADFANYHEGNFVIKGMSSR